MAADHMNGFHHHDHHHGRMGPETALYLISKPAAAVVSLADMKAHLRVDHNDDDNLIESFTAAATAYIDGRDGNLGRALIDQTWELRTSFFPRYFRLPLPPLIEVGSVKYIDVDGAEQTFSSDNYHVVGVGDRGRIYLRNQQKWPVLGLGWPEPAIVQFRAGYIDSSVSPAIADVPMPIVNAIKLMTGTLYQYRETISVGNAANLAMLPWSAEALLAPFRVYGA